MPLITYCTYNSTPTPTWLARRTHQTNLPRVPHLPPRTTLFVGNKRKERKKLGLSCTKLPVLPLGWACLELCHLQLKVTFRSDLLLTKSQIYQLQLISMVCKTNYLTRLNYYNVKTRLVEKVGLCWLKLNLVEQII